MTLSNAESLIEEDRILLAAYRGALYVNAGGRYVIEGESRPDVRARARLTKRDWITASWHAIPSRVKLTDEGMAELRRRFGDDPR